MQSCFIHHRSTTQRHPAAAAIADVYLPGLTSTTFNDAAGPFLFALTVPEGLLRNRQAPSDSAFSQPRFYQNIFGTWEMNRLLLAYDLALSFEKHAPLHPENGYSLMYSATGILQYSISKRLSAYARGSWFSDPHETLTGPIENDFHNLVGLQAASLTAGVQVKPTFNSYLRFEGRGIQSMGDDPEIFFWNGAPSVYRLEGLVCAGVWF